MMNHRPLAGAHGEWSISVHAAGQVRRAEEAVGLVQEEQAAAADRARESAAALRRLQVILTPCDPLPPPRLGRGRAEIVPA